MSYSLNHNFFDVIDTEQKAYFLGLMFADGCVQANGRSFRVRIGLHIKDRHILDLFKSAIKYTGPLYVNSTRVTLEFSSPVFGKALIKHGCIPRKSLILKHPTSVSSRLFWHFIRGYFDGDGCLSINRNKHGYTDVRWSLVGTEEFLSYVSQQISSIGVHCSICKSSRVYILSVSGNRQIGVLLQRLYAGAKTYLERKYQKKIEFQNVLSSVRPIRIVEEPFDENAIVNAYLNGMKISEIEQRFIISNRTMYKFLKKRNIICDNRRHHSGTSSTRIRGDTRVPAVCS